MQGWEVKLSAQPGAPSAGRMLSSQGRGSNSSCRGHCCQAVPTCRGVDAFLLAVGTALVVGLREGLHPDTVQAGGGHIRDCGYGLLHLLLLHLLLEKAEQGERRDQSPRAAQESQTGESCSLWWRRNVRHCCNPRPAGLERLSSSPSPTSRCLWNTSRNSTTSLGTQIQ